MWSILCLYPSFLDNSHPLQSQTRFELIFIGNPQQKMMGEKDEQRISSQSIDLEVFEVSYNPQEKQLYWEKVLVLESIQCLLSSQSLDLRQNRQMSSWTGLGPALVPMSQLGSCCEVGLGSRNNMKQPEI